jgi:YbgC/YbaW family acyl-CoA thioester hydrolase
VPYEFKVTRQVEFSDTDMAGIMHFSNFFRFMETAEHAFFRSLGFSIHTRGFDPPVGWPRVHAVCDYKYPLRFEDVVEIQLLVRHKRPKRITYAFVFRKLNEQPVREVARGELIVACVTRDPSNGEMRSVAIPAAIAEKIEAAPPELFES